jgi:hypothetical protein
MKPLDLPLDHILVAFFIFLLARPAVRWGMRVNPVLYTKGSEMYWVWLGYLMGVLVLIWGFLK